jgi:hypothetical protein
MSDDHLTPEERRALDALPRQGVPPRRLEERTVEALRARGLLRPARPRGLLLSPGYLAAAAVVALAAILGAFTLGQYLGGRQTADAMLAMHRQDSGRLAESVQRASAAYLTALSDLTVRAAGAPPAERDAGREAVRRSLYQAADQLVRLAPDDPLASRILQAFEQAEAGPGAPPRDDVEQQVIWF